MQSLDHDKNQFQPGWFILGFFLPLVGLILYLMSRVDNPGKARSVGLGSLISTGIVILGAIL